MVGFFYLFLSDLEFVDRNSYAVEDPCIMDESFISPLSHIIKNGPDLFLEPRAILNFPLIHSLEVTFKSLFARPKKPQLPPCPSICSCISIRNLHSAIDDIFSVSFFDPLDISPHVGQFLLQAFISSIQMIHSRYLRHARRC